MNAGHGRSRGLVAALTLVIALAACAPTPQETETATSVAPSVRDASASPGERVGASPSAEAVAFPIAAFADISEGSVPDDLAAEFQAALEEMAGDGGMSATVMSPDGTWSGAAGKADGVRKVTVDDQFGGPGNWNAGAKRGHFDHTVIAISFQEINIAVVREKTWPLF